MWCFRFLPAKHTRFTQFHFIDDRLSNRHMTCVFVWVWLVWRVCYFTWHDPPHLKEFRYFGKYRMCHSRQHAYTRSTLLKRWIFLWMIFVCWFRSGFSGSHICENNGKQRLHVVDCDWFNTVFIVHWPMSFVRIVICLFEKWDFGRRTPLCDV